MVSAAKMRRAQDQTLATRPYVENLHRVLADMAEIHYQQTGADISHPLLEKRAVKNVLLIIVAPDKGLCGGLNTNIQRFVNDYIKQNPGHYEAVTVGKKARDFALRAQLKIIADFVKVDDNPEFLDIIPIAKIVMSDYTNKTIDEVRVIYTHFISTLSQQPIGKKILPIERQDIFDLQKLVGKEKTQAEQQKINTADQSILFEPSPQAIFDHMISHFIEMEVFQSVLEAKASEHSARMVAMKSASDNAGDIIYDLTLSFNEARQASITQEVAEISAGSLT